MSGDISNKKDYKSLRTGLKVAGKIAAIFTVAAMGAIALSDIPYNRSHTSSPPDLPAPKSFKL
jgi:hypothetical protein